jgi:hypothetical protein
MKTFIGVVKDSTDVHKTGLLKAHLVDLMPADSTVPVIYTTPTQSPLGGGFVAPVENGSRILIFAPDNDDFLYYGGTVVTTPPTGNDRVLTSGDNISSTGLTSKEGAGLEATTEISDSDIETITRLKGHGGAGQAIINSHPGNESVTLQAQGLNSSIKVNGYSNKKPDQIEINASNSVTSRARKGSNMVNVGPAGGELKILNEGFQSNPFRTGPMAPFNGDVRVESENNNVIIQSCADPILAATDPVEGAGVTIRAGSLPNPLVEIRVDSQGFVNIIGATGINMEATTGNIELNAPAGQINLRSGLPAAAINLQPTFPEVPIPPAKR